MALKRGFKDFEEHDSHIISQWNEIVTKHDTVWILGDITMEKSGPYQLLSQMKGIKKVVLGNHDQPQHVPELLKYVNKVCGSFKLHDCIFTHIPIHPYELNRYDLNIHGHLHDNIIDDNVRFVNVSMELINYQPVLLNDVIENRIKFIYSK